MTSAELCNPQAAFRLYDLMFARCHPVPGPNSGWVTVETHIRPRGRGWKRRCSRVKGILPAARSPSHVTPGQAAPASCPDPLAPQSGPPISGPYHRDTLGLLRNVNTGWWPQEVR